MTLKANVDITFNNILVCRGFKIIDAGTGAFVSKPSQKGSDGKYYDQIYILQSDEWDEICEIILDEYEKVDNK